jgi:hypothetical protein
MNGTYSSRAFSWSCLMLCLYRAASTMGPVLAGFLASAAFADSALSGSSAGAPAVSRPLGQSAVLLGGGVALASDLSAVDHNPAGIAVASVFSVEGATAWRSKNIQSAEIGVIDSAMSDVAAALKFRQTSSAIGQMERRFSIALADGVGQSGLLVGLAGDYKERPIVNQEGKVTGDGTYYDLRAGAVYSLSQQLRVAVRTGGYFDEAVKREHSLGVGALVASQVVLNGDIIFVEESPNKATAGVGLIIRRFFDLRASYGYLIDDGIHQASGGLFLVSPKVSLFYLAVAEDLNSSALEHQVGLRLALMF